MEIADPDATGRYFLRLAVTGHPDTAETYDLGNRSVPGVDQRRVIDAGFGELTRLGELPASDPRCAGVVEGSPKSSTVVVSTVAGADGHFRAAVPAPSGMAVVTVAATRGAHATGWAQVTV